MKRLNSLPLELIFWTTALILLAIAKPEGNLHSSHFTLCPLANLGIDWCPGCGLGRSITHLFHGDLNASLQSHLMGIPAVLIIGYRVLTLAKANNYRKLINKEKYYV